MLGFSFKESDHFGSIVGGRDSWNLPDGKTKRGSSRPGENLQAIFNLRLSQANHLAKLSLCMYVHTSTQGSSIRCQAIKHTSCGDSLYDFRYVSETRDISLSFNAEPLKPSVAVPRVCLDTLPKGAL